MFWYTLQYVPKKWYAKLYTGDILKIWLKLVRAEYVPKKWYINRRVPKYLVHIVQFLRYIRMCTTFLVHGLVQQHFWYTDIISEVLKNQKT